MKKIQENTLRYLIAGVLLIIVAGFILYNLTLQEYSPASYSETKEILGTIVTITLYDTEENPIDDDKLVSVCHELFDEAERLELVLSAKLGSSELSYVNTNACGSPVPVSDDLFNVFDIALRYCRLSDGALDISIGNLIRLWNIGSDNPHVPSSDELFSLIGLNNWENVILDYDKKTIYYKSDDISVDLGAVAKGYIGDILKEYAISKGISCGLLNLGGNLVAIGERYDGSQWTIGITNPFNPGNVISSVKVSDMSVVTSGNYERYFEENNVRYHHILNPSTGYPADSGVSGVTIIGSSSACCDSLSTACFILGVEKGLELIEACEGYEAIFIDNEGKLIASSGIDQ